MATPYTYLIGWPEHNKWYYGVRYAKDANPGDLWVTYFTSSEHVSEYVAINGNPSVRQIRKIFETVESARQWEERVLKRMGVVQSDMWLNRNDSMAPPINPLGNLAMRLPHNRKKASDNNKGSGNPNFGKKATQVTCLGCKKVMGLNTFTRWHGPNCIIYNPNAMRPTGESNPMYGKSSAMIRVTCVGCKKEIDIRNYHRSHGNKCKSNVTNLVANAHEGV